MLAPVVLTLSEVPLVIAVAVIPRPLAAVAVKLPPEIVAVLIVPAQARLPDAFVTVQPVDSEPPPRRMSPVLVPPMLIC